MVMMPMSFGNDGGHLLEFGDDNNDNGESVNKLWQRCP
jgi:hypothetical protein